MVDIQITFFLVIRVFEAKDFTLSLNELIDARVPIVNLQRFCLNLKLKSILLNYTWIVNYS